jgi:hypothetical protein
MTKRAGSKSKVEQLYSRWQQICESRECRRSLSKNVIYILEYEYYIFKLGPIIDEFVNFIGQRGSYTEISTESKQSVKDLPPTIIRQLNLSTAQYHYRRTSVTVEYIIMYLLLSKVEGLSELSVSSIVDKMMERAYTA